MAVLTLHCCVRAFSSSNQWGYSSLRYVGFSWGFSCCGVQTLGTQPSAVAALGLSSCKQALGTWAQQSWCMGLDAPRYVNTSKTRDWTCVPCSIRQIRIHCTTREVPRLPVFPFLFPYHKFPQEMFRLWHHLKDPYGVAIRENNNLRISTSKWPNG